MSSLFETEQVVLAAVFLQTYERDICKQKIMKKRDKSTNSYTHVCSLETWTAETTWKLQKCIAE
jgi:hypothetical protein